MWKLSTGKIVEMEMKKMVEECKFEHPCHSFIFDTGDENWLDFFTQAEINETKTYNVRNIPEMPEDLSKLLDNMQQSVNACFSR